MDYGFQSSAPDHRTKRKRSGNGSRSEPQLMRKVWKAHGVKDEKDHLLF